MQPEHCRRFKMKIFREVTLCLFLLNFFVVAQAGEDDFKRHPGYVNLDEIKIPDKAGEVTEIHLGPALLKLMSIADDDEEDDLSTTLSDIKGIQVKTFEIGPSEAENIIPIMDRIEEEMNHKGWERLVLVKEKDERVVVSIKPDEGKAVGLLVMSLESSGEASFVNIVGTIDLKTIGNMDINLKDSTLDSLKKHMEKDKD
jgi:hypothetical protein